MSSTSLRLGVLALGLLVSTGLVRAQSPAADPPEPTWTPEQKGHWAFVAPTRPEPPVVKDRAWVKNPIDAFILNALEGFGLTPAPEADRPTLIRRLSFDLTGLPPTPRRSTRSSRDTSPRTPSNGVVDRLLASPPIRRALGPALARPGPVRRHRRLRDDEARSRTAWRYPRLGTSSRLSIATCPMTSSSRSSNSPATRLAPGRPGRAEWPPGST